MIIVHIKGGLGNQLFQYATAKSLAKKLNTNLLFDLSFFEDDRYKEIFRLDYYNIEIIKADNENIKRLKNKDGKIAITRILKKFNIQSPHNKKTHWRESQLNSYYKNRKNKIHSIYLEGWLSNPNYFIDIKNILSRELVPTKQSPITLQWKDRILYSNSIAIHIRRGDYLTNDYFHNLPLSYYMSAISYIYNKVSNPHFFFFSDDIEFVMNEFKNVANASFVNANNQKQSFHNTARDIEDLHLISLCKHQIIANSTFSWWGAWLNENVNKIVIAPKIWSNNIAAQKRYEEGNLIPKSWLKIEYD